MEFSVSKPLGFRNGMILREDLVVKISDANGNTLTFTADDLVKFECTHKDQRRAFETYAIGVYAKMMHPRYPFAIASINHNTSPEDLKEDVE